jgi:enoyl-CoA hydratase
MIHVEAEDGIALVRFDRPPANAIELESARELEALFARLEADASLGAMVLTGQGSFFSAGLDLKIVPTYAADEQDAMVMTINGLIARLYGLRLPVVAAVNGHAVAGGLVIALACDYRIGVEGDYKLGLTETRVAVPYPVAAMTVVETELAPAVARRLVLLAENAGPADALAAGVLDELVPAESLVRRAQARARELAALPRFAYAGIKRQLRAVALERVERVLATGDDPVRRGWITAETAPAAARVLGATASR